MSEAWNTIFKELEATTTAARKEVEDRISEALSDYRKRRQAYEILRDHEASDRQSRVASHAKKLAALAKQTPGSFVDLEEVAGIVDLVSQVDGLEQKLRAGNLLKTIRHHTVDDTKWWLGVSPPGTKKKRGRPTDWPFDMFVSELGRIYVARTGRQPARSNVNDSSRPGGPFHRLLAAACDLDGEKRKAGSIAAAIRRLH